MQDTMRGVHTNMYTDLRSLIIQCAPASAWTTGHSPTGTRDTTPHSKHVRTARRGSGVGYDQ